MKKLNLILFVFALVEILSAQNKGKEQLNYIDRHDLKEIVETLASKEFYGRQSGVRLDKRKLRNIFQESIGSWA